MNWGLSDSEPHEAEISFEEESDTEDFEIVDFESSDEDGCLETSYISCDEKWRIQSCQVEKIDDICIKLDQLLR